MTTSDIINIVATVATAQLVCELLANHFIFASDTYERALGVLSRAQYKLKKLEDPGKVINEKQQKKLQMAKDDVAEAASNVSRRHTSPNFFTSVAFVILYRILGTEYNGKIVAVMPFAPWSLIRRFSMRGIVIDVENFEPSGGLTDPNQACSFLFVYILCTLAVKFFVSKAVGTKPPKGAEGGLMGMLDAPQNQKLLKQWGMDTETLSKND
eukprot:CAMPEP_0119009978 /NCGR_PEP_ID=MMETSP1176-20130426/4714_1 /TAXON_ID=265551 /ORGANISM="Synedropsis recta cf, Strain CCMP1620" /LENGTH=210 /DNA_ID=CAMNT_0006962563 /DNA_START=40 /DNA_END=672 /DNA_ORIENTATION=+